MSIEAIAAATADVNAGGEIAKQEARTINMAYQFSLQDSLQFERAYQNAGQNIDLTSTQHSTISPAGDNQLLEKLMSPFADLNKHSKDLAANVNIAEGQDFSPSELLKLTMRSHEFLFHCELTSNVANRSSDGVTQLFRQQS